MRSHLAALSCLVALAGCSGLAHLDPGYAFPSKRREHVSDATEAFASNLRWGRIEQAASFVAPEYRIDFLHLMAGDTPLRFTDYEVLAVELGPSAGEAQALVTFRLHRLPSMSEIAISDAQRWRYDTGTRRWRVTPDLAVYRDAID